MSTAHPWRAQATYALTIFLSAFLLFQVQPLIGKYILPWFGGTPGVWTTCILFFQILLLAGYAYAHASIRWLTPRRQVVVHLLLLGLAVAVLPIIPSESWKPVDDAWPVHRILGLLAATLGLPYLLVSTTGPLIQAWFARELPGTSPYRLYALSNLGSLLGLISYPFVVEPNVRLRHQGYLWSAGFVLFVGLCAASAIRAYRASRAAPPAAAPAAAPGADRGPAVSWGERLLWLLYSALGSVLLLATTNQMSQDVAVVPFLWVLPLSLYLLSFILCFDHERWYFRPAWYLLLPVALGAAFHALLEGVDMALQPQIIIYCFTMFVCCMVCHGELARTKPHPRRLTEYFLLIALGGALGGVGVTLVAPAVFKGYWEYHAALALTALVPLLALWRQRTLAPRRVWSWFGRAALAPAVVLGFAGAWFLRGSFTRLDDCAHNAAVRLFHNDVPAFVAIVTDHFWVMLCCALVGIIPLGLRAVAWLQSVRQRPPGLVVLAIALPLLYVASLAAGAYASALATHATRHWREAVATDRNFYGVLRVDDDWSDDPQEACYTLMHGRIKHGLQFRDPERRLKPTSYYAPNTGVGLTHQVLFESRRDADGRPRPLRLGTVGLGAGCIAAWGRPGDAVRFYEINPMVVAISDRYFTYRRDSLATVDVVLGDARISLERQAAAGQLQQFDLLSVDAFSGDAIPLHLLTVEAFELYWKHLKPDGVLAVHISNRYLELAPLVRGLAARFQKQALRLTNSDEADPGADASTWILVTSDREVLEAEMLAPAIDDWRADDPAPLVFSDDYSNLFQLLRK